MFCEQSDKEDLLKCQHCSHPYDEYYPPRILSCCKKTVCYECVKSVQNEEKDGKFKCLSCKKEEVMPKGGFMVNTPLVEFISKKPKSVYRGAEAEKLKQNTNVLEETVGKLSFEMDNGDYIINEECFELMRQVQTVKEKRMEEINQVCNDLFKKIEVYKRNCIQKYNEMKQSMHEARELIKEVNDAIKTNKAFLNQLKSDDNEIIELNKRMENLKTKVKEERRNTKSATFDNHLMKFETNATETCEDFLGKLEYETINYIVINYFNFFTR